MSVRYGSSSSSSSSSSSEQEQQQIACMQEAANTQVRVLACAQA
jgi:hypothetical protein